MNMKYTLNQGRGPALFLIYRNYCSLESVFWDKADFYLILYDENTNSVLQTPLVKSSDELIFLACIFY